MAERIGSKISRGELKRIMGSRDRFYDFLVHQTDEIFKLEDDFAGPVLDANKWTVGNGGGLSAASAVVSVGLVNGAVIAVTGTAADGTADSFISSGRHFRGDQNAIFLCRLQVSAITSVKIECGLTDSIASATTHTVNSKSGNSFIATDGVCWIFDTNDTGRGWDGMGVSNASGATRMTDYNVSPVAATYETLQIALVDTFAYFSRFDVDGNRTFGPNNAGSVMTAAARATILLAPYVSIEARNGTSKTLTIDRIKAYQARTSA